MLLLVRIAIVDKKRRGYATLAGRARARPGPRLTRFHHTRDMGNTNLCADQRETRPTGEHTRRRRRRANPTTIRITSQAPALAEPSRLRQPQPPSPGGAGVGPPSRGSGASIVAS